MNKLSSKVKAALIVVALIAAVFGLTFWLSKVFNKGNVLTAAYVTAEPKLDGIGNDTVWSGAEETDIPIVNSEPVKMKAVYTKDRIFFQARFKDTTKDDIDRPWRFDGKKWVPTKVSDQFGLFFDIGNSITDFKTKGLAVMEKGFKKDDKMWNMEIIPIVKPGKVWGGSKQRGDLWMMHSSISSPFGMGDDAYFGAISAAVLSPDTAPARLVTQWDTFFTVGVLELNTTRWKVGKANAEGRDPGDPNTYAVEKPYLKYGDYGKNIDNTPYPFADELVEITANDTFKKGDKLPYVYFNREANGNWGDSRGDITGKMAYKDGYWTVEMGRLLDTGFFDDIRLNPKTTKEIWFAPMLRTDGVYVRPGTQATLKFAPKGGN